MTFFTDTNKDWFVDVFMEDSRVLSEFKKANLRYENHLKLLKDKPLTVVSFNRKAESLTQVDSAPFLSKINPLNLVSWMWTSSSDNDDEYVFYLIIEPVKEIETLGDSAQ